MFFKNILKSQIESSDVFICLSNDLKLKDVQFMIVSNKYKLQICWIYSANHKKDLLIIVVFVII